MRLCLIQMNSKTASRDENVERACAFIDEAARRRPEVVVLPEFFNVEYFPQFRDYRYMDYAETEDGYTQTRMKAKAREHGIHIVSTIFEAARPGFYYDTAMLINPEGRIVGKYRRCTRRRTSAWRRSTSGAARPFRCSRSATGRWASHLLRQPVPESCRCLMLHGAELIIAPYATPVSDPWENFLTTRALENGVYLAACNHVGQEGEWAMSGKSMIIDPLGKILVQAGGSDEQIISADVDRDAVIQARRRFLLARDRRPDAYRAITTRRRSFTAETRAHRRHRRRAVRPQHPQEAWTWQRTDFDILMIGHFARTAWWWTGRASRPPGAVLRRCGRAPAGRPRGVRPGCTRRISRGWMSCGMRGSRSSPRRPRPPQGSRTFTIRPTWSGGSAGRSRSRGRSGPRTSRTSRPRPI
jgi:N-carbamoylputrescine amidase